MATKDIKPQIEILPKYSPEGTTSGNDSEMCIVLHGYGRLAPTAVHYIDNYKFVGGVGRNIPRSVATAWKKGVRTDGKPAVSRVFPQAILPADATEVDFAAATGINPVEPAELAALINATDAQALIAALGRQKAAALIDDLKDNLGKIS